MQLGGAVHTFRTADGVARFPAVWSAGTAVVVTARFTGPVSEPKALLGSLSTVLTPVAGQPGAYRGSVSPKAVETGDLRSPSSPSGTGRRCPSPRRPRPRTRSSTRPRSWCCRRSSPAASSSRPSPPRRRSWGRRPASPGRWRSSGCRLHADGRGAGPGRRSGVLAYGSLISGGDPRTATNGRYSAVAASIVDAEWLRSQASPELRRTLTTFAAADAAFRIGFKYAFELATNADQVYSVSQFKDKYDLVADLQKMALNCSSSDASAAYQKRAETLLQQALALDVFTAVSAAAGLVLAPVTFGLGTVAVWAVTWAMGKALELKLQDNMEALQRALGERPGVPLRGQRRPGPARRRRPGRRAAGRRRADGPAGVGLRPLGPGVRGAADPPGRRGHGDRAPVDQRRRALAGLGRRAVRPAQPAAHRRPRRLRLGRPPGLVEGALGRCRLAAGRVPAAEGAAAADRRRPEPGPRRAGHRRQRDGRPDRHHGRLHPAGPGVRGLAARDAVGGDGDRALGAGRPQVAPGGEQLALAYRFVAASPLSGSVPVRVDGAVQDHAGRALADAWSQSVTVGPAPVDRTPPTVTVTGVKAGERYVLGAAPAPACRTVDDASGVRTPAALAVTGGSPAGVGRYTATCSGAVDKAGNAAAAVSASWTVAYAFTGLWSPERLQSLRGVKAGSTVPVPLLWRITDAAGTPVKALADGRPVQPPLQRRRHRR